MQTENEALLPCNRDFPGGSEGKVSGCSFDLIPRSGRPPGEENGKPFQYSCLEDSMDRGAWQTIVHGVARVGHGLVTKPRDKRKGTLLFEINYLNITCLLSTSAPLPRA